MFDRFKAVWAKFTAAFWTGFEQARAQSRAWAQPAPDRDLAAAFEAFFASAKYKDALAGLIKAAFADGVASERARVAEILQAPGAEELPQLAMFLVLGDATAVQATSILAKAENDASKRVAMTRAQEVEPAIPTLH
jgi:hypothetical protein